MFILNCGHYGPLQDICVYTSYLVLKKKTSGEIKRLILLHLSFKIGLVLVVTRDGRVTVI